MKSQALLFACVSALAAADTPLPTQVFSTKQDDFAALPHGNHAGSILEFMYQPAVMVNTDTAGFSRAEDIKISMMGESTRWQRWYALGANITNPARPGEPLIYMPLAFAEELRAEKYATMNTAKNGIHIDPMSAQSATRSAALATPFEIGGPTFVPRATADREPASDWGAPSSSRGFANAGAEGSAIYTYAKEGKNIGYLGVDAFWHRRKFNNLASPESAGEFTVTSALSPSYVQGDSLNITMQGRSRTNLGAEYFLPESQTLKSNQIAATAIYNLETEKAKGSIGIGYAYRDMTLNGAQMTRSLVDTLIQPPLNQFLPEKSHTGFFDASGYRKDPGEFADIQYGVDSRFEFLDRRQNVPQNLATQTLYSTPYQATRYDAESNESNFLLRWQPYVRAARKQNRYEFGGSLAGHFDWGFTPRGTNLAFIHPTADLKAKTYLGSTAIFVGGSVLHDTLGFTLQEVSFLNRDSLSGTRYNYSDINANGTVDSNELSLPKQTGGRYHSAARLEAPQKEEANLLFGYTGIKDWLLQFNLNARIYRKLFEVRSGGHGYELRNAENDAHYAHAEITVAKMRNDNAWIFRSSIGGYYGAGYSPQGLNAFYNDAGAYNESTAEAAFRENRFGRLDNDRGYIGKIIFGYVFAKVLSVANVIRYRDGEPVAGYRIATGSADGVVAVQTEERGGGVSGVGRHTYSFAWDLRLRFDSIFSGNKTWAYLDIYNLLNSRTELAEYPLVGVAFRDPVEQGIARTARLGFGMNF